MYNLPRKIPNAHTSILKILRVVSIMKIYSLILPSEYISFYFIVIPPKDERHPREENLTTRNLRYAAELEGAFPHPEKPRRFRGLASSQKTLWYLNTRWGWFHILFKFSNSNPRAYKPRCGRVNLGNRSSTRGFDFAELDSSRDPITVDTVAPATWGERANAARSGVDNGGDGAGLNQRFIARVNKLCN